MALTQDDINNIVNGIVNTYTNQRIAYHGGYPGECTSPVKYYVENVTGQQAPYMANDRADGWGTNFPAELAPFFYHEAYQPGKAYPKGTILMWNNPHIAIVVYDNGSNSIEVFEQNADPDGAPCKTTSRVVNNAYHTCTYALIPIVVNPQPTPPPPPAPKYTVIETYPQGKQIQLNKDTSLWGMNYEFAYMVDHPVETGHKAGEIWTVTNKVHHEDGYDYYRRDGQVDGFNVADCDDYTPPAPPYVPPAAPVTAQLAEKYTLVTTLVYYPTADDAKQRTSKAIGPIFDGTYYVVAKDAQAYKLSKDNKTDIGWVNINDNKLPVVEAPTLPVDPTPVLSEVVDVTPPPAQPAPITDITPAKAPLQWGWINDNHQPSIFQYQGTTNMQVKDLENHFPPITIAPGTKKLVSRYTVINEKSYLLPDKEFEAGKSYGIEEEPYMKEIKKLSFFDEVGGDLLNFWDKFEEAPRKVYRLITDISPVKRHEAVYKTSRFIDGFKSKGKK